MRQTQSKDLRFGVLIEAGTLIFRAEESSFDSVDRWGLDSEGPELPPNVERKLWATKDPHFANLVFGDFEVCPLEPEKPGAMQAACIESAKNLVVEK